MIKVGFFFANNKIASVDLSSPQLGNPGIGGTEYQFLCVPYYINKFYQKKIEFNFYAQNTTSLPNVVSGRCAVSIDKAYEMAVADGCDILVWRPVGSPETLRFIEKLDANKEAIKVIAWVHNTLSPVYLNALSACASVKRFVVVSDEQLDIIRHESIFYKGCVIVNGLDASIYRRKTADEIDADLVVYIGAMIPAKGFAMLARVWKRVLEVNHNAKLYVIGSGKLYDREQVLGEWDVADESFESESIRPYLSDESGNIHPSVKFLGTLGKEKIEYMRNACAGIVNPTALTENCPGSALEFQALGTPVVSGADWGLLDTVHHGETGLLGKTDDDLVENILFFMNDTDKSFSFGESGIEFVNRKFSYYDVAKKWVQLFKGVVSDKPNNIKPIYKNFLYKNKWLREVVRLAKDDLYSQDYNELNEVAGKSGDRDASVEPDKIYHDRVVTELLKSTKVIEKKYKKLADECERFTANHKRLTADRNKLASDLKRKEMELSYIRNSRRWKVLNMVMGVFGKSW